MLASELEQYLAELLELENYSDYAPNGLQVSGRPAIKRIVTGVTACYQLLERAVASEADAILVHHGYFWRGEPQVVTGIKRERLRLLLLHDINLFAYHLPLDGHAELGNNVQLAKKLGVSITGLLDPGDKSAVGNIGTFEKALSAAAMTRLIATTLSRTPLYIAGHNKDKPIKTLGFCTGAAQSFITKAVARGVDAYLTGEVSEQTVHIARESGVHFFAAGHHATERYGIQALGGHLAARFGLEHEFVDIDNPA